MRMWAIIAFSAVGLTSFGAVQADAEFPPELIATWHIGTVWGLARSSSGQLFYGDSSDELHRFSPDFLVVESWTPPACGPFALAAGAEFVYLAQGSRGEGCSNDNIFQLDLDGSVVRSWCPNNSPDISVPPECKASYMAVDTQGNLFVTDGHALRKYDSEGTLLGERWADDPATDFAHLAVGADGSVYVPDRGRGEILRFSSDLTQAELFIPHGSGDGTVSTPFGLTFGPGGDLFVMDRGRGQIERFDFSGQFLLSWAVSNLFGPAIIDGSGYLYVGTSNGICKFDNKPGTVIPPHGAGIFLHVGRNVGQRLGCESLPEDPSGVVTLGASDPGGNARYYLYLLATPKTLGGWNDGTSGMQMGILAETASENGEQKFAFFDWVPCSILDFPQDGWPASGTGNTITWFINPCQQREMILAGYLYVSSYAPTIVRVTGYPLDPQHPNNGIAKVANCDGAESVVGESSLGWVSFGGARRLGSDSGCNPVYQDCAKATVPVRSTTWGKLKSLY